ncbi:flagellar basal-body MS-ring/collar protein FliF [Candidatus Epulonipiscium viviparus]|uniref:flagellar basal-body MS-ring/collar protein FliF n=1 Tax=Candidatus Epulonipiscium viviparus TaxID=420336 RepID=UPI002738069F|nr:flagellar basal-body MS-ring/collar protein FliF [Candidatus Epulopiscium viviparus]
MRETITQVSNNLTERWTNLPSRQKIQIGVGAGAIIVAIIAAVFFFSSPQTAILYQNLDMEAISQIDEVLGANNITYELIDGRTIQVNEEDLNTAKIILTRENVPRGDYTFYDAITNSMSTTEAEKRTKLIYLKQVDLENILMGMEGIAEATVQLNVPEEKNSFIASQMESSASVVLTLHRQISDNQIEGIARLLSNAVDNLKLENITILDSDSNVLFSGDEFGEMTASDQQSLKSSAEKDIVNKLTTLLSPIYDEVAISPNLILDFDYFEQTKEEYTTPITDSQTGLVDQERRKNYEATNIQDGFAPGLDPNVEDVPEYVAGNELSGNYEGGTSDIIYKHNKTLSNEIKNIGTIDYNNSSVAINLTKYNVYDEALLEDTLPDGQTWAEFKLANDVTNILVVEQATIDAIKMGAGLENVAVIAYEKPVFIDKEPFTLQTEDVIPYILLLALGAVIVVVMIRFRKPVEEVVTEDEFEFEDLLPVAGPEEEEEDSLQDIELKEVIETKAKIDKFIDEKPEAVAGLLRNWLEEDWGD